MDGRSTSDIDGAERFVFFVLHLSCFSSSSSVSEPVKSHKTIYSDDAAALLYRASVLRRLKEHKQTNKQTAIHNKLFANNTGCRN